MWPAVSVVLRITDSLYLSVLFCLTMAMRRQRSREMATQRASLVSGTVAINQTAGQSVCVCVCVSKGDEVFY